MQWDLLQCHSCQPIVRARVRMLIPVSNTPSMYERYTIEHKDFPNTMGTTHTCTSGWHQPRIKPQCKLSITRLALQCPDAKAWCRILQYTEEACTQQWILSPIRCPVTAVWTCTSLKEPDAWRVAGITGMAWHSELVSHGVDWDLDDPLTTVTPTAGWINIAFGYGPLSPGSMDPIQVTGVRDLAKWLPRLHGEFPFALALRLRWTSVLSAIMALVTGAMYQTAAFAPGSTTANTFTNVDFVSTDGVAFREWVDSNVQYVCRSVRYAEEPITLGGDYLVFFAPVFAQLEPPKVLPDNTVQFVINEDQYQMLTVEGGDPDAIVSMLLGNCLRDYEGILNGDAITDQATYSLIKISALVVDTTGPVAVIAWHPVVVTAVSQAWVSSDWACATVAYRVHVSIRMWSPMLAALGLLQGVTISQKNLDNFNDREFTMTVQTADTFLGEQKFAAFRQFCGVTYEPPGYASALDIARLFLISTNATCRCHNSLLSPALVADSAQARASAVCFDDQCSAEDRRNFVHFSKTAPTDSVDSVDSVCKKSCERMWSWLYNTTPQQQSRSSDNFDRNRFEALCGKDFNPIAAVRTFDATLALAGFFTIVPLSTAILWGTRSHRFAVWLRLLVLSGAVVLLALVAWASRELAGLAGCTPKPVCRSRSGKYVLPSEFCQGAMLRCECETDQDCQGVCINRGCVGDTVDTSESPIQPVRVFFHNVAVAGALLSVMLAIALVAPTTVTTVLALPMASLLVYLVVANASLPPRM